MVHVKTAVLQYILGTPTQELKGSEEIKDGRGSLWLAKGIGEEIVEKFNLQVSSGLAHS